MVKKNSKIAVKEKEIFYEAHKLGFDSGAKYVVGKILQFIEKESEFTVDVHSDSLLDRLVNFIKKI